MFGEICRTVNRSTKKWSIPLQLQAAPNRSEAKIASQAHSPARHLTEAFRLTEVVHCGEGNHLSAFLTEHPSDGLEHQGLLSFAVGCFVF